MLQNVAPSLLEELTKDWSPPRGARIVVAASGGADSTALLRLLAGLAPGRGWSLHVATFDHGVRGAVGRQDLRFVESLASDLAIPCVAESADGSQPGERRSEADLRAVRREFLERIGRETGASAIALAHTLDDQAETVLFRLARGSGMLGAGAMARWNSPYWRPALGVRRRALREILLRENQEWREDESNASLEPARNSIRLRLLPLAEELLGPGVAESLARAARLSREDEEFLARGANALIERATLETGSGSIRLDRGALLDAPSPISRRVFREALARLQEGGRQITSAHLLAIESIVAGTSSGARVDLPGGIEATRTRDCLILRRRQPESPA